MKQSKIRTKGKKVKMFHPRKKKNVEEEEAAIKYLQSQYHVIAGDQIKMFKDLPLSQKTLKGLKENNYMQPTEIQKQAISLALQGKDILGSAKTGSGKTLAFLIPILESLYCKKWSRWDGTGAVVISPTRELAYQIYETLRKVGHLHDFSAGLIIGGQNLKFEKKRMDQVNILICTPGRLLQHMDENPLFNCDNLQILVLDEADRCLDLGFADTMNAIIENLPPKRQTMLFSATQTKSVKDLARLSLSFPSYVAPHEQSETVTPESLQQSYIVCEVDEKIGILWSFIRNHLKQKVLIFMATCKQVKYVYDLFCRLRPGISLLALYGTLHQEKREKIYNEFCRKSNVILFATDLASRGLDFPKVNWVIQTDCPEDVDTYIHRAGRTARGIFGKGEGLLILLPHEEKFVEDLKKSKIPINKISVDPSKVQAPQMKIEALLSEIPELKQAAQRAFVSYIKSLFLMKNKEIFNLKHLDTESYARSLGLIVPPTIKFLQKLHYSQKNREQKSDIAKKKKDNVEDSQQSGNESDVAVSKREETNYNRKKIGSINFKFHNDAQSDSDEEFLKRKDKPYKQNEPLDENIEVDVKDAKKKKKPLTKAAVAKKLIKKNVKINTKVTFTEEGDAVENDKSTVKSDFAKQYMNEHDGKLDIEKSMKMLREEDKFDKQRFREKVRAKHKEQKRKLKNKRKNEDGEKDDFGSQPESDGPDLSWLPDPDKIYGKNVNEESDSDNGIAAASYPENAYDEFEENFHRPSKRKLISSKGIPQDSVLPRKRNKLKDLSTLLSVQEAEQLAMRLLKTK